MEVIWIDDSSLDTQTVINYVFNMLWEKNIRSKIFIIGNQPNYTASVDSQIKKLNCIVVNKFLDFLIDKGKTDELELYQLINRSGIELKAKPESDIAINKSVELNNLWNKISASSNKTISESEIKSLFVTEDKEKPVIMIDICLFESDYTNLLLPGTETVKILSMYLYNAAKKAGYKTFMYTSHAYSQIIANRWKENYFKLFEEPDDDIRFFSRKGQDVFDKKNELIDLLSNKSE